MEKTGALVLVALLSFSFMATLGPLIPSAHAATVLSITSSNGSTVCPAAPLSGTWDPTTDTCSTSAELDVTSGETLDIGTGVTVAVSTTGSQDIYDNGTINNDGTINLGGNPGDGLVPDVGGTLNNAGTIDGGSGTEQAIWSLGAIYNYGTVSVSVVGSGSCGTGCYYNGADAIWNGGTIDNYGTMSGVTTASDAGPGIENYQATINNYGTLSGATGNGGSFGVENDQGTISEYCGATLSGTYGGTAPVIISCHTVIPSPQNSCEYGGACFTSFIAFNVTSGGQVVNASVTISRAHGPTVTRSTLCTWTYTNNHVETWLAWYDVSILDTVSYTVTLPNGQTVSGTVSNPDPWTVTFVNISG